MIYKIVQADYMCVYILGPSWRVATYQISSMLSLITVGTDFYEQHFGFMECNYVEYE